MVNGIMLHADKMIAMKKVVILVAVCLLAGLSALAQNLKDFYNYKGVKGGGYAVSLSEKFKKQLNSRNGTFTSQGYTWKIGDPLPNPAPNGQYKGKDVVSMSGMFAECYGVASLDLSQFDTRNVADMSGMFEDCGGYSFTSLDLSGFDTRNVTDMTGMFARCSYLTSLDLSGFDTRNVVSMSGMFYSCRKLAKLDLSSFNTQNVVVMVSMFENCTSLTSLDLSHFDTRQVVDMSKMFHFCSSLARLNLAGFDTHQVTDMSEMFNYCSSLTRLDLSSFTTGSVRNIYKMFANCKKLNKLDVSGFDTSMLKGFPGMHSIFSECGMHNGNDHFAVTVRNKNEAARFGNREVTKPRAIPTIINQEEVLLAQEKKRQQQLEAEKRAAQFDAIAVSEQRCVDLGLSVYWCGYNMGASAAEQVGGCYVWGELEPRHRMGPAESPNYTRDYYRLKNTYSPDMQLTFHDVVSNTWGNGWHIPSRREMQELLDRCKIYRGVYKGMPGYKFVGPNGNAIFLPAPLGQQWYILSSYKYYRSEVAQGKMIPDISAGAALVIESKLEIDGISRQFTGFIRPVKNK